MKEITQNTFDKGLVIDANSLLPTTRSLSNCLNGTIITQNGDEFILQNDNGNYKVGYKSNDNIYYAKLNNGFIPIGMKEYGGILYIVSVNPETNQEEIGSFPSPDHKETLEYITTLKDSASININDSFKQNIFSSAYLKKGDQISLKCVNLVEGEIPLTMVDFTNLNKAKHLQKRMSELKIYITSPTKGRQDVTDKYFSYEQLAIDKKAEAFVDAHCQVNKTITINIEEDNSKLDIETIPSKIDKVEFKQKVSEENGSLNFGENQIEITYNCPDGEVGTTLLQQLKSKEYNKRVNYINKLYLKKINGDIEDSQEIPINSIPTVTYDMAKQMFKQTYKFNLQPQETYDFDLKLYIEGKKDSSKFITYTTIVPYRYNVDESTGEKHPLSNFFVWNNNYNFRHINGKDIAPNRNDITSNERVFLNIKDANSTTLIWFLDTDRGHSKIAFYDLNSDETTGKVLPTNPIGVTVVDPKDINSPTSLYRYFVQPFNNQDTSNNLNKEHCYVVVVYKSDLNQESSITTVQYFFPNIASTYGSGKQNLIPMTDEQGNPNVDNYKYCNSGINGTSFSMDNYGEYDSGNLFKINSFALFPKETNRLIKLTTKSYEYREQSWGISIIPSKLRTHNDRGYYTINTGELKDAYIKDVEFVYNNSKLGYDTYSDYSSDIVIGSSKGAVTDIDISDFILDSGYNKNEMKLAVDYGIVSVGVYCTDSVNNLDTYTYKPDFGNFYSPRQIGNFSTNGKDLLTIDYEFPENKFLQKSENKTIVNSNTIEVKNKEILRICNNEHLESRALILKECNETYANVKKGCFKHKSPKVYSFNIQPEIQAEGTDQIVVKITKLILTDTKSDLIIECANGELIPKLKQLGIDGEIVYVYFNISADTLTNINGISKIQENFGTKGYQDLFLIFQEYDEFVVQYVPRGDNIYISENISNYEEYEFINTTNIKTTKVRMMTNEFQNDPEDRSFQQNGFITTGIYSKAQSPTPKINFRKSTTNSVDLMQHLNSKMTSWNFPDHIKSRVLSDTQGIFPIINESFYELSYTSPEKCTLKTKTDRLYSNLLESYKTAYLVEHNSFGNKIVSLSDSTINYRLKYYKDQLLVFKVNSEKCQYEVLLEVNPKAKCTYTSLNNATYEFTPDYVSPENLQDLSGELDLKKLITCS